MHIFTMRRLIALRPRGIPAAVVLVMALAMTGIPAAAQAQGKLTSQPGQPNAAAYQAPCQDAAVAAEIARLEAEIAEFDRELGQANQRLQTDQQTNPAQAANDRQAIVALRSYIALDEQRLSALRAKPPCQGKNPPPPPGPEAKPNPNAKKLLVNPSPVPVPAPNNPKVWISNVTVPGPICVGQGYYYTLNIHANGSNEVHIQNLTIAPAGVASVAYDIPSQTITGVGLAGPAPPAPPATAIATAEGYVIDGNGDVYYFQVNVTVSVQQCPPPRNAGPTIIGPPPTIPVAPGEGPQILPGLPGVGIGIIPGNRDHGDRGGQDRGKGTQQDH